MSDRHINLASNGKNQTVSSTIVFTFTLIAILYLYWFGVGYLETIAGIQIKHLTNYISINLGYILTFILIYLGIKRVHGRDFLTLITAKDRLSWKKIFLGFGIYSGILALTTLINWVLYPNEFGLNLDLMIIFSFLMFFPFLLVITTIQASTEELIFRGYLTQGLALHDKTKIFLVGWSSFGFTVYHLPKIYFETGFSQTAVEMILFYLIGGFFFSIISLKSNSIELALGAHTAHNFFNALTDSYKGIMGIEPLFAVKEISPFMILVIAPFFYWIIFKQIKMNENKSQQINKKNKDKNEFVCPWCDKPYKSKGGLRNHIRKEHDLSFRTAALSIIITIVVFIISIYLAYAFFGEGIQNSIRLSEESLNKTFLMTSPVVLAIDQTVDEEKGEWKINVTNTHPLRETGAIYLFRLEKNPYKPHMLLEEGLGPGDSRLFTLQFKSKDESIAFNQTRFQYGFKFNLPVEAYYVYEHISIAYKLTCDNCPSQGIIRRLPQLGGIPYTISMNNQGVKQVDIHSYEWLDFELGDILINKTEGYL